MDAKELLIAVEVLKAGGDFLREELGGGMADPDMIDFQNVAALCFEKMDAVMRDKIQTIKIR